MDMDKAPLNRAHQLERKADTLNRQKKLDECIQCHAEAVELYNKCLQIGSNKDALDSIKLQKEWNERQIRMLQLKKSYLERTEQEKKFNGLTSSKQSQRETGENLEAKIFRNFDTHDSLICYLAQRGIIHSPEKHCHSTIAEVEEKDESPFIVGNKHPKDDSTVIEELKELSGQLRESVQGNLQRFSGFLVQLTERKKQNEQFKEHIKNLELEEPFKEGLLIQLDDRNREIEQLKAHIRELELQKPQKEAKSPDKSLTTSDMNEHRFSSASSETDLDLESDFKSLPPLDLVTVPTIDMSAFKEFRIPEVSSKLLRKDD